VTRVFLLNIWPDSRAIASGSAQVGVARTMGRCKFIVRFIHNFEQLPEPRLPGRPPRWVLCVAMPDGRVRPDVPTRAVTTSGAHSESSLRFYMAKRALEAQRTSGLAKTTGWKPAIAFSNNFAVHGHMTLARAEIVSRR
jgi:hypothetical protein